MAKIYDDVTQLIGNTPLVRINKLTKGSGAIVLAKLEFYNPANSVKDRLGVAIIDAAEKDGSLKPGGTIVEATSGNTGIALAFVAAARGYKVVLTMPETMSLERRALLRAFGAELILTPGPAGMKGAVERVREDRGRAARRRPRPPVRERGQPRDSPQDHGRSRSGTTPTARWTSWSPASARAGRSRAWARFSRPRSPACRSSRSSRPSRRCSTAASPGPHKIQGIGANFIPEILNTEIYDEVIDVDSETAVATARAAAREEGLLVGISSGAALHAASIVAKRPENKGKTIVVIIPSFGERYLSSVLYADLMN